MFRLTPSFKYARCRRKRTSFSRERDADKTRGGGTRSVCAEELLLGSNRISYSGLASWPLYTLPEECIVSMIGAPYFV